jgi:hypothetical protein
MQEYQEKVKKFLILAEIELRGQSLYFEAWK